MSTFSLEEIQLKAFELIAGAGEAKANYYQAMDKVKVKEYEEAKRLIELGDSHLHQVHNIQTSLLAAEASGDNPVLGIIMVHAQDHLMNAILAKELLQHLTNMQKEINSLKERLELVAND